MYRLLQDGVVIETSAPDSSLSLKKRHYNAHRSELAYGGFLDSTSTECRRSDGGVVITHVSGKDEDRREEEEIEGEGEGRGPNADDFLFKACGGRTAHK